MAGCFGIVRDGSALLWKHDIDLTIFIRSYSGGHIDMVINHAIKGIFPATGFYGNPEASLRMHC